jgi:hypothetical protein
MKTLQRIDSNTHYLISLQYEKRIRTVFLNALRVERATSASSARFAVRVQACKAAEHRYDVALQQTEKALLAAYGHLSKNGSEASESTLSSR